MRQHIAYMLSALYAIARPSDCPSVTRVYATKRFMIGSWNFHHTVAQSL